MSPGKFVPRAVPSSTDPPPDLPNREAPIERGATDDARNALQAVLEAERRARGAAEAALARLRRAETALRESEARLSLALDKADMGVWEIDLSSGRARLSDNTAAMFGFAHGETTTTLEHLLERVDAAQREALGRALESAATGDAAFDVEFRTVAPDGTIRWVHGKGRRAPDSERGGVRLIGIGQDVTFRKEAEASLRRSEHLLRTIIDSTTAFVYVVDATGRFLLLNRQFAAVFGWERDAAIGRTIYDYFPAEVADQFAANNWKVLERNESCEFEEIAPHADGPHTYLSIKSPLYDEAGQPYAVCGVSTDITESTRLLAELHRAQRQKDAAIATIAHELRQPLNAISAALGVMRRRPSREHGEEARAVLERQVGQLSRLVEDLLDAARLAQGMVTLRREPVALQTILGGAVAVVKSAIHARGQTLDLDMPAEPLNLSADAQRLQQVFSNLLMNASKFTDKGGRIALSAVLVDGTIIVRVRDTGRGIRPDVLPHIFDLFTQASPDDRGMGIGLAVVRELVTRHGGTIEARSAGIGHGSEFIVSLPLAAR